MTPDKLVDIVKINFDEQKIENYINAGRLTVHQFIVHTVNRLRLISQAACNSCELIIAKYEQILFHYDNE